MKKIAIMLALAVISMGVYAQTSKGDSSFGLTIGGSFDDDFISGGVSNHATLGIDYRLNLTNEIRVAPSITHFVKNDHVSGWAIDVNANYVFSLK